jgi:hypothetical protein
MEKKAKSGDECKYQLHVCKIESKDKMFDKFVEKESMQ